MLSRLEVFAAVAAVVAAFHTGAEVAAQLEHRRLRRDSKGEDDDEEERRKLQVSLETAESLIAFRYAADIDKVGDVGLGDDIARDRLLYIAVAVQINIIQSLQLAVNFENAVLDLPSLHEASIANRKDTIEALDELKHRVLLGQPLQRTASSPRISRNSRGSIISVLPSRSPSVDSHSPKAVSPAAGDLVEKKSNLARYFFDRRMERPSSITSARSSVPTSESVNFHPALTYLLRGKSPEERKDIMNDIDELIAAYRSLAVDGDRAATLAALTGQTEAQKRDTLAALMAGSRKGNAALHYDPLQMLRRLPPTPGEHPDSEYSAYDHNVLNPNNDKRLHEWVMKQQPTPVVSRWSDTTSSIYSDHTITSETPSLLRYDSTSSYRSDSPPFEPISPPHHQTFNQYAPQYYTTPYSGTNNLQTPMAPSNASLPVDSLTVAPRNARSRPTTPTNRAYQDKPLPPIIDHHETYHEGRRQGRGGMHLNPNEEFLRRANPSMQLSGPLKTPSRSHSPITRPITPISRPITPHVFTTITTAAQEKMMSGRPCKDNNYWGFCKGAWATREELRKGLNLETRPNGMYSTSQVWRCKHCHFDGPSFSTPHPTKRNKKEVVVDPHIYTSSVGIRYRWIFLVKSHVHQASFSSKQINALKKVGEDSDCSFGCMICSVERTVSGIFGNVETLMNHIFLEHARPGHMSSSVLTASNCVQGRIAGPEEDWDLNIPNEDTCVLLF